MPVDKLPVDVIRRIIEGGEAVCTTAGIPIAGGHTIDSVEPIYGLVALGIVHPEKVKKNSGAQAGDMLVLGKPLGVGVYSAALKKDHLDAAGYREMLASTTKLNTPGPRLSGMAGVHALTDVTGFGLLGHLLEICRGSKLGAELRMSQVPLLPGVESLVEQGHATGASGRNWAGYGKDVVLDGVSDTHRKLLTDPQTSGGLLVSCAQDTVDAVLRTFRDDGFERAAVIGRLAEGEAKVRVAS
jgi:selenide,water dikinase